MLWISSSCSWAPGCEDRLELKGSTFCLSSKLVGPEICVLSPLKLCLKRITEHPEFEETHSCHQVQLLASHKTKQKNQTIFLSALSKCFLYSGFLYSCSHGRLGAMSAALGSLFCAWPHLLLYYYYISFFSLKDECFYSVKSPDRLRKFQLLLLLEWLCHKCICASVSCQLFAACLCNKQHCAATISFLRRPFLDLDLVMPGRAKGGHIDTARWTRRLSSLSRLVWTGAIAAAQSLLGCLVL